MVSREPINWDNFSCPLQAFKFSIYYILDEAFGNKFSLLQLLN